MKISMKVLSVLVLGSALMTGCERNSTGQSAAIRADRQGRLQVAEAMFQERCKTAGEKVSRTVNDVEGILLMKLRPEQQNFSNLFALEDPYGRDLGGKGYIESFIYGEYQATHHGGPATPMLNAPPRIGYSFVEAVDPQDGKRYRYTGRIDQPWLRDKRYGEWVREFVLDKVPASGPGPSYGVTYEDISTREERQYWIAGGSLKVIDLQTNEVIAERIGYMMDRGQGATSGGRSPWLMAADHACPQFKQGASAQAYQALDFVEKTLKHK